jgi:outer membrane protein
MPVKFFTSLIALCVLAAVWNVAPTASRAGDMSASNPWAGTQWLIRGRIIGMIPDESDGMLGGAAAGLEVDSAVVPELDFSYFFTDRIAVELILAATPHDVELAGTGKITELWVLPPTLTVQYHHPMGALKPYVGAGINYTTVLSSDATAAIGGVDSWDDSIGFALQFGADYAINDRWSLNFDVKKIWLNLDATVTAAGTAASVDLDPWVVGAGIGYRF